MNRAGVPTAVSRYRSAAKKVAGKNHSLGWFLLNHLLGTWTIQLREFQVLPPDRLRQTDMGRAACSTERVNWSGF